MLALVTGLGVLGFGMVGSSDAGLGPITIWPIIVIVGFITLLVGVIAIRRRQ
jgi:hypothetical protein